MSDIEKVKKLRKSTGAGFKDCNAALKESNGDLDKAAEILRIKGIAKASKNLYKELSEMNYSVLLDDRKDGYGVKIKDSELIGIPLNIVIGKKFTEKNEVELIGRNGEISSNSIEDIKTILEFFKN